MPDTLCQYHRGVGVHKPIYMCGCYPCTKRRMKALRKTRGVPTVASTILQGMKENA